MEQDNEELICFCIELRDLEVEGLKTDTFHENFPPLFDGISFKDYYASIINAKVKRHYREDSVLAAWMTRHHRILTIDCGYERGEEKNEANVKKLTSRLANITILQQYEILRRQASVDK